MNSSLIVLYITLSVLRQGQGWFLALTSCRWATMDTHILHGTWFLESFNCTKRITECDQRQQILFYLLISLLKQIMPKCASAICSQLICTSCWVETQYVYPFCSICSWALETGNLDMRAGREKWCSPWMQTAWHNILFHRLNVARITNLIVGLKKAWFSFSHDNFKLPTQSNEVIAVSLNLHRKVGDSIFYSKSYLRMIAKLFLFSWIEWHIHNLWV